MSELELTPSKETYKAIKADIDVTAAFKELIDNAIDNAIRERQSTVRVEIEHRDSSGGEVVIQDDSGGIARDELDMLFALGESRKEGIRGSIGAFGIGAKKALMRLGRAFTVTSRHSESSTGWGYSIDQSWIDNDEEWTVPLEEYDLPPGHTALHVTEPNFNWERQQATIRDRLAQTYQLYLADNPVQDVGVHLELIIDGSPVPPPNPPAYSYTPWDDLFPRRFEGIVLSPSDIESTVELSVTVGLMETGDETEAGTDVFCQNRLVVHAARDPAGGFDIPRGLPAFRPEAHKRLKIQAEFTTDGDAADLPWNADKSRVRTDHPMMRAAREWIRDIADRYMQARYGEVPSAFFDPYTSDSEYAANDGEIAGPFDYREAFAELYQGRRSEINITERPRAKFTQIKKMQATVDAHARLGIRCDRVGWFEEWMLPTYHRLLDAAIEDSPFDSMTEVTKPVPDVVDAVDIDELIDEIDRLGAAHAEAGIRYTDPQPIEQPRYERALQQAAATQGMTLDELTPTADPESDLADESAKTESAEDADSGLKSPNSSQSDGSLELKEGEVLKFGPFTDEELLTIQRHLGEVTDKSPADRREALIEYLNALDAIGIDPDSVREF
jgi:hypothetical protein